MGGKKKHTKHKQSQPTQKSAAVSKQPEEEKRFVNLLHVYTIYKQKFRRLSKAEYEEMLRHGCKGKQAAIVLCKEFMKAKQIPEEVDFEKNVGFLSVPRLMPLIALLAERAGYKMKPSLVSEVYFSGTPARFQDKFAHLLVDGVWFLGRVISDSLSIKDQVNRGNVFNFAKGDMGFWWAAVRILDWNYYVHVGDKPKSCSLFVTEDPPKYRQSMNRAIFNMHQHPLYFLSETDWINFKDTVNSVRHRRVVELKEEEESVASSGCCSSDSFWDDGESSQVSSMSSDGLFFDDLSDASVNTVASRESIE